MPHAKLVCLTVAGIVLVWSSVSPAPPAGGTYMPGSYALMLDGKNCGLLKAVEGGAITAEVINEPAGPSSFVKKHIGPPKYEDLTIQVGFGMDKSLYDWIGQSWLMKAPRKDGSVIATDYQLQAQSEQQFRNAMITETTIPAMDGASREPAYIAIKLSPEFTRVQTATGKLEAGESRNPQKAFLPQYFRLEIAGLDCSRVNKIDSFTVKQTLATAAIGDAHDYAKEPGKLEFPNLRILIPEANAQSFKDWHESFVVQGRNDETCEKNGVLTLLAPDGQTPLARIKFFNLGICRLQPEKTEASADTIRRLTVELYVERMEFEYIASGSGSTGTTTPPATTPTKTPVSPTNLSPIRRG